MTSKMVNFEKEEGHEEAISPGLHRSHSWHLEQPIEDTCPERPRQILLKARSGLIRCQSDALNERQEMGEQSQAEATSKDMKSAWDEDVAARRQLLRVSTVRFQDALDQVFVVGS